MACNHAVDKLASVGCPPAVVGETLAPPAVGGSYTYTAPDTAGDVSAVTQLVCSRALHASACSVSVLELGSLAGLAGVPRGRALRFGHVPQGHHRLSAVLASRRSVTG